MALKSKVYEICSTCGKRAADQLADGAVRILGHKCTGGRGVLPNPPRTFRPGDVIFVPEEAKLIDRIRIIDSVRKEAESKYYNVDSEIIDAAIELADMLECSKEEIKKWKSESLTWKREAMSWRNGISQLWEQHKTT